MAQRIEIPGHGIYFVVRGKIYTTPTPSALSIPIEFGEFGRIVAGPEGQVGGNSYGGFSQAPEPGDLYNPDHSRRDRKGR